MTAHIGDMLGAVEGFAERVGHDITSHIHPTSYHSRATNPAATPPGATAMGMIENIEKDLTEGPAYLKDWALRLESYTSDIVGVYGHADDLAAKLERYTQEPIVEDVLGVLEAVPTARDVLTPVLAGLKMLASGATTAPTTAAMTPTQTTAAVPTA